MLSCSFFCVSVLFLCLVFTCCKLDLIFCLLRHALDESRACHQSINSSMSLARYRSLRLKPATGLDDSRNACHGQEHARSPARTASPDSFHSFPYAGVKTYLELDKARFLSSITWDGSVSNPRNMPQGASTKISDCNINTIKAWINSGYPNN